ncbi:MAG: RNA polymerase sigma factor [Myxococcota bacterium]
METTIDLAQAGNREALNKLLEQHRGGVYRYGLTVCRTTEDTEDAVQLTLWSASRAIGSFRRAASFTTWLFTIVRNWCLRLERGNRRACHVDLDEHLRDERDDVEGTVQGREFWRAIAGALATLEPQYREVVILRDIEGRTAPEAADALGITVEALKTRLHRARRMLRESPALRDLAPAP